MQANRWSTRNGGIGLLLLAVFLLLALTLAGCAGGDYGSLRRSYDVTRQIESYEVLPEYNYYYSGPASAPLAILGVHRDYQLVSELWHPIGLTTAQLRDWMVVISPYDDFRKNYHGAYIVAPDGGKVGIWYSQQSWTVVRFPAKGKIAVYTPELNDFSRRLNRQGNMMR